MPMKAEPIAQLIMSPITLAAGLKGVNMTIDDGITLSSILQLGEILSILAGGGMVAFKVGKSTSKFEEGLRQQSQVLHHQSKEIQALKEESKRVSSVLTTIAVQSSRIDHLEEDIREMKHGRGFVKLPP